MIFYNQVKFADVSKIPVKGLNIVVYYLEGDQFIVLLVAQTDKVKACIATENELVVSPFKEVAKPRRTPHNVVLNVLQKAGLILFCEDVRVVLAQA